MKLKRIGIDLAKQVFQVHGVDHQTESAVLKRRLTRGQMLRFFAQVEPTLIGMEACASSHYWARELSKLGHTVKLIPPQYVKPYVKTNKNDANDAEAICEAVSRPSMRFVTIKHVEQQALQSLHRVRERVVRSRTALINEIRGLLGECGIVLRQGVSAVRNNLPSLIEDAENGLCVPMRTLMQTLYEELVNADEYLASLTDQVKQHAEQDQNARRIQQLPGVGPITASAIVSSVGDAKQFQSGREFAAWLGIVPRQHSSGGKERLVGISKRGDSHLRTLLIHGARAALLASAHKTDKRSQWLHQLMERRNKNIATVALANKQARVIWAMLTRQEDYRCAA
jgi:transposase